MFLRAVTGICDAQTPLPRNPDDPVGRRAVLGGACRAVAHLASEGRAYLLF